MKMIKIGDAEYPYKVSLLSVSKFLREQGYSFGRMAEYLADDEIGNLYKLVCHGVNKADKDIRLTPEKIDEVIPLDLDAVAHIADQVMAFFGIEKDEKGTGGQKKK